MARLTSAIDFEGPIGNLSAYRMRGIDRTVIRKKGGPTKKMIKHDPAFDITRRRNAEFDGVAKESSRILRVLRSLKPLADYNMNGPLTKLMGYAQVLDTESEYGKRGVLLSRKPMLLDGYPLNRKVLFDSIVRASLPCSIDKATGSASIDIPALIPGINFMPAAYHTVYRIQAVLGVVPDLVYADPSYSPTHPDYEKVPPFTVETAWHSTRRTSEAITLELQLSELPPDTSFTLILGIGIAYGTPIADMVEQVKHAGAAKVMRSV